ncbi:hypothetical protein HID58_053158 [Brassica napus]|uniref:Uncharacterized protein n=1 Tax=Brassica napus TaxID=3708 RepID=A0ABQ8ADY2_BRANA|nr:hypothetical protein HID58_053158 [Brassica napus]
MGVKLRLEGVSGDDVVELLSLGLYRWIDRWRWHWGFDCCGVPSWIEAVERVSGAFVWVARGTQEHDHPLTIDHSHGNYNPPVGNAA